MDPFSQERRLREAGVPRDKVYRDIGVSGATGTDQRQGWHRLDGRLSGGDILVVVRIDRIGRRRRTREGLAAARARGKTLGRRRSLTDDQVQLARRMKDAGASGRKIAGLLEVNEKMVRNALKGGP